MPPRSSLKRVGGLEAYVLMMGQLKMRTLCGKSYGRNIENRWGGIAPKNQKIRRRGWMHHILRKA